MSKHPLLTIFLPIAFGLFILLIKIEPTFAQPTTPGQASHFSGYKQQLKDGTMPCEGFSTSLTSPDYRAEIKYRGDQNCCGIQTDGDGIWIGGNSATPIGVDFIRNQNRLQFKDLGPGQIASTTDGQWHTYSVSKIGTTATMTLDGQVIKTDTAAPSAPETFAIGGSCTDPTHINNWNNFWYDVTFYSLAVCAPNSTAASVATNSNPTDFRTDYGNILLNQTTAYIKGSNSAGILRRLTENPNGWVNHSPINNRPDSVNIFGWKIGPHTITATGGGENYCSTTGTATFNCINQPPSITTNMPKGQVTSLPNDYTWQVDKTLVNGSYVSNFGMDSCGANANTNDDKISVALFDGSGCAGVPIAAKACDDITNLSASNPSGSCSNKYSFPNAPHTYSWQLTAKNGPTADNTSAICTDFTYQPSAAAWWQTDSGHVYGALGIKSLIPCTGSACKFNLANLGSPGIVAYHSGSADFNGGGNLSQTGWLAGNVQFLAQGPLFDELARQLPVAPIAVPTALDQITLDALTASLPTADAYYLQYSGSGNFHLGRLNVNDKKVVIYTKTASEVDLDGDISVNQGKGFFGLITTAPVRTSPDVTRLDTLIFTEKSFSTGFYGSGLTNDKPLVIRGMVVAKGAIQLERDLDRTHTTGQNSSQPAEKFIFAPDYLFLMPRGLRRFRYQLSEVPPTQ